MAERRKKTDQVLTTCRSIILMSKIYLYIFEVSKNTQYDSVENLNSNFYPSF